MVKMMLIRKQIFKRDMSVFGTYLDYLLEGMGGSLARSCLSERQMLGFFRYFLDEIIIRTETYGKPFARDSYVFLAVEHVFFANLETVKLLKKLSTALKSNKCTLVLELKSKFPPMSARVRISSTSRIVEAIYTLGDLGILFGLKYYDTLDELTNQMIIGKVFSFFTLSHSFKQREHEENVLVQMEHIHRLLYKMQGAGIRCIAEAIDSREDMNRVIGLPFYFYAGDLLSPPEMTEVT